MATRQIPDQLRAAHVRDLRAFAAARRVRDRVSATAARATPCASCARAARFGEGWIREGARDRRRRADAHDARALTGRPAARAPRGHARRGRCAASRGADSPISRAPRPRRPGRQRPASSARAVELFNASEHAEDDRRRDPLARAAATCRLAPAPRGAGRRDPGRLGAVLVPLRSRPRRRIVHRRAQGYELSELDERARRRQRRGRSRTARWRSRCKLPPWSTASCRASSSRSCSTG